MVRYFFVITLVLATAASASAQEWQKLFDGKTLKGWQAPDMSYFSVEDGAITGTTTKDHNPPYNQFIVWQGGEVGDFELKFKFRIFGAKSNSGMQFRSTVKENGLVHGYQADMDGAGKFLGGIWDEYGTRRSLAGRGEKVLIDENGKKIVEYKDKDGHIILRKVQIENNPSEAYAGWLSTQYVYDEFGLLRFVFSMGILSSATAICPL